MLDCGDQGLPQSYCITLDLSTHGFRGIIRCVVDMYIMHTAHTMMPLLCALRRHVIWSLLISDQLGLKSFLFISHYYALYF